MEEKCDQPTNEKSDPKSFINLMKNLCEHGIKGNLTKEGTDFIENLRKQTNTQTRETNLEDLAEKCARQVEEKLEDFDLKNFMETLLGTEIRGFKTHITKNKQNEYDKKMQEPVINVKVEKETSQSPFMNENHRLLSTYSQIEEDKMKLENYIKNLDDDARNAFWRSYHGINTTDVQLSIIDRKLDVFNDCMEELLTEIQILRKEVRDNRCKCKCSSDNNQKQDKSITCNSCGSNDSNFSDNLDHSREDC